MSRKQQNSGLWAYLDQTGILATGSSEEIETAKRTYWKTYFFEYRRARRKAKPEFIVSLSKESGEYQSITAAAKKHRMTVTAYLRTAALGYTKQIFIVPDRAFVARLADLLSQCANEVQAIAGTKERYFWQREEKIAAMEKRIERLEQDVRALFESPPELTEYVLTASPEVKARLLELLA